MDEEDQLHEDKGFKLCPPEVQFALTYNLESEYSRNRFSLLNEKQIRCIIHFLEYNLNEKDVYLEKYGAKKASNFNKYYQELKDAIATWKIKALVQ